MNRPSHRESSASIATLQSHAIRHFLLGMGTIVLMAVSAPSEAAFILEIDTDSLDDGPVTFNANFSFGGDTTTASSSVTSPAFGTTGGDSIFGGDGSLLPDTYLYSYSPASQADNLAVPAGTNLGGGNFASGLIGGGAGNYRVYATWPFTMNVSGGDTRYTISTPGVADVVVDIDQNGGGTGAGDEWIMLGDIDYSDLLSSINVMQQPTVQNSFVSMRAYGLLFERLPDGGTVPEPGSLALLGVAIAGLGFSRRRKLH